MTTIEFPRTEACAVVRRALVEDLGELGDITTAAVFPQGRRIAAVLVAREPVVLAGVDLCQVVTDEVAALCGPSARAVPLARDGDMIVAGAHLARLEGDARNVLAGERVLLNALARLCGIATATRRAVEEIRGLRCTIADTRKTTPGLRALEKYAVAIGGGERHRAALDQLILVKDNHKELAGGLRPALEAIAASGHDLSRVEAEVETLEELEIAIDLGCGWILLDNMSVEGVAEAVRAAAGRAQLEVSGGLTPGRLRGYAQTGIDRISMGYLTHSAPASDLSLDLLRDDRPAR